MNDAPISILRVSQVELDSGRLVIKGQDFGPELYAALAVGTNSVVLTDNEGKHLIRATVNALLPDVMRKYATEITLLTDAEGYRVWRT